MNAGYQILTRFVLILEVVSLFHSNLQVHIRCESLCRSGYSGHRCEKTCPYPQFGFRCEGRCGCSLQFCNHITGCPHRANCQPGFAGEYCERQCLYPKYGYGCLHRCSCPKKLCHFSTGCSLGQPGSSSNTDVKTINKESSQTSPDVTSPYGVTTQHFNTKSSNKAPDLGTLSELFTPNLSNPLWNWINKTVVTEIPPFIQHSSRSKFEWMTTSILVLGVILIVFMCGHIVLLTRRCKKCTPSITVV